MTAKKTNTRRWRRRLLGSALGLLLGLLMAEGTLRVLGYSPVSVNPLRAFHCPDPTLVYRGRPHVRGRFRRPQFDVEVRHDARGFRMPEYTRDRAHTGHTVHVFGDSFTWGWGVETGEVFTDGLRRALPAQSVRNYGINGSGTALHKTLLETEVAADVLPGDVVVLMFFYNDFLENLVGSRLHGRVEGDRVVEVVPEKEFADPFSTWLKGHSYLANYVAYVVDMWEANRKAEAWRALTGPRSAGPDIEATRVTRHYLRAFRDLCRGRDAEVLLVWVPDSRDVAARAVGQDSAFFGALTAIAADLGVELLDPTDALVAAGAEGVELYFDGDEHWTPAGHALIAAFLAERLGG